MSLKLEASNEALDEETFKDNLEDNLEEGIPNDELASKQYPKEFISLQACCEENQCYYICNKR